MMIATIDRRFAILARFLYCAAFMWCPASDVLAQETQKIEKIEITGSSIRAIEGESALPVTIIKGDDLRKAGITTVEEALRYIPSNQTVVGVSQVVGGNTGGRAEANLRALGSNKTLVLLNGRRLANQAYSSGIADLYSIPISAIERIEILRDGASAIYGTDSIGGVINFITKTSFKGLEISAENQTPENTGGREKRFTLAAGQGELEIDKFNVLAIFDYHKQAALRSVDRDFATSGILPERGIIKTSGNTFPANVFQLSTGVFGNPYFPACAPPASISNPSLFGTTCALDYLRFIDLIPENEQKSLLLRTAFRFNRDHGASIEYVRTDNRTVTRTAPQLVFPTMTPANPYYPGNGITPAIPGLDTAQDIIVSWRLFPAGQRTIEDKTLSERVVGEITGNLGAWDYRMGLLRSKSNTKMTYISGFPELDLFGPIGRAVQNGDPLYLNPFGDPTPAEQSFISSVNQPATVVDATGTVTSMDALARREFSGFTKNPISLAIGAETRREEYAVVSPRHVLEPVEGSRTVSALLTEAIVPITETLETQLAVRYDRYSDVGSTANPKIALRYQPAKTVLLRASANSGFRAPTLYELNFPDNLGITTNAYNDPLRCPNGIPAPGANPAVDCRQQFGVRRGGNKNLEPEKSNMHTVGIVLQPTPGFSVSMDYWSIRLKNQINTLGEQAVFGDPVKYAARFIRCGQVPANLLPFSNCAPGAGFDPLALGYIDTPNENLGETRTDGIDFGMNYRFSMGSYGRVRLDYDGTYVKSYKFQREKDGPVIDNVGRVIDTLPIFRWQHVLSAKWDWGNWSTLLVNRYKSGYEDQNDLNILLGPEFANRVGPYSVWDFAVTWSGIKNLNVTAGVKNIFDKDPPFSNQGSTFQANYDPRVTSPVGRAYLIRLIFMFK